MKAEARFETDLLFLRAMQCLFSMGENGDHAPLETVSGLGAGAPGSVLRGLKARETPPVSKRKSPAPKFISRFGRAQAPIDIARAIQK